MGIKVFLSKYLAHKTYVETKKWADNPVPTQDKVLMQLLKEGKKTKFGRDHNFEEINNYSDFKKSVPIRDYEGLRNYIEEVKEGAEDVLWPGRPIYFCKTSGTTSGTKYIPITKESMPNHIHSARNALLSFIKDSSDASFVKGKMIFLQGNPSLEEINGIPFGRLSGIVAHHVPSYLQKNRMPSYATNCIEDWEKKIDAIVEETIKENMTMISGIPSWIQMYFEKLISQSGKNNIMEIFPNLKLIVYGGVNFEPYRNRFDQLIGQSISTVELYPASEGFIAFQDRQDDAGMLLVLNEGIYYEFIRADEFDQKNPERINVEDVQLDVNYVIILNTNAGLWGYNIGDTVKFVSLNPHRIIVSGRIKHFTSAFGEHVIAQEVEQALQATLAQHPAQVVEFVVAPQVTPQNGELPYHEWFIEFEEKPKDLHAFRSVLDMELQKRNSYYLDLRQGKALQTLKITDVKRNGFLQFMKSKGKLGGQNKIPRLSNNREIADKLENYTI